MPKSGHTFDQSVRTSDFATSRVQSMNASTAGLSVRFFRNTISAEIRGPAVFSGKTFNAARCALSAATDAGRIPTNSPLAMSETVS
ncbi:MAG TPA: hypothetical protein VGD75_23065, partial [Bradyrhizobium sp.]